METSWDLKHKLALLLLGALVQALMDWDSTGTCHQNDRYSLGSRNLGKVLLPPDSSKPPLWLWNLNYMGPVGPLTFHIPSPGLENLNWA